MRLFRAEWSRLFARRFTKIMIVFVLAVLGLIGLGVALSSQRPSPAVTADAKQLADQQREDMRQQQAACEDAKRDPAAAPPDMKRLPPGVSCAELFNPDQISCWSSAASSRCWRSRWARRSWGRSGPQAV
jgi:hypothetical protein